MNADGVMGSWNSRMLRSLISYRYKRKHCPKCERVTNHRIPGLKPVAVVILSILTLGGFFVLWLLGFLFPLSLQCTRCGSANSFEPVGCDDLGTDD